MSEQIEVKIEAGSKGFAEDKDGAKLLRRQVIMPALAVGKKVILDFSAVTSSTQSFVHALVGEPLQKIGEAVLEEIEFRSCAPQIKSLVQLVVDYTLGGFTTKSPIEPTAKPHNVPSQPRPQRGRAGRPRHRGQVNNQFGKAKK
jgi:STAS-like domain of unknown function (DUF4325)